MSPVLIGIGVAVALALGVSSWKAPRLTSVIVWSMTSSIALGAAITKTAVGVDGRIFWMIFTIPVLWVAFQLFCYWEQRKWLMAGTLIGVTISSVGVIVLS